MHSILPLCIAPSLVSSGFWCTATLSIAGRTVSSAVPSGKVSYLCDVILLWFVCCFCPTHTPCPTRFIPSYQPFLPTIPQHTIPGWTTMYFVIYTNILLFPSMGFTMRFPFPYTCRLLPHAFPLLPLPHFTTFVPTTAAATSFSLFPELLSTTTFCVCRTLRVGSPLLHTRSSTAARSPCWFTIGLTVLFQFVHLLWTVDAVL